MRVALAKKPKSQGPGLLLLVVALVVVAVAGARFFGFVPGRDGGGRPPGDGPRVVEEGPSGGAGVLPRPQQMTEVLIYHTHTTENYSPKATHATDGAGDVAAVGRALVEELEKQGVNSVHLLTVHDLPQWGGAAQNARTSVAEALERNSGVRIVLDIHRDAIADPPAESGYALRGHRRGRGGETPPDRGNRQQPAGGREHPVRGAAQGPAGTAGPRHHPGSAGPSPGDQRGPARSPRHGLRRRLPGHDSGRSGRAPCAGWRRPSRSCCGKTGEPGAGERLPLA